MYFVETGRRIFVRKLKKKILSLNLCNFQLGINLKYYLFKHYYGISNHSIFKST